MVPRQLVDGTHGRAAGSMMPGPGLTLDSLVKWWRPRTQSVVQFISRRLATLPYNIAAGSGDQPQDAD